MTKIDKIIDWIDSEIYVATNALVNRLEESNDFERGMYKGRIDSLQEALAFIRETIKDD